MLSRTIIGTIGILIGITIRTYLSSTFDTLDHNILSIGLNEIGIHGQVHNWFMYFF